MPGLQKSGTAQVLIIPSLYERKLVDGSPVLICPVNVDEVGEPAVVSIIVLVTGLTVIVPVVVVTLHAPANVTVYGNTPDTVGVPLMVTQLGGPFTVTPSGMPLTVAPVAIVVL